MFSVEWPVADAVSVSQVQVCFEVPFDPSLEPAWKAIGLSCFETLEEDRAKEHVHPDTHDGGQVQDQGSKQDYGPNKVSD